MLLQEKLEQSQAHNTSLMDSKDAIILEWQDAQTQLCHQEVALKRALDKYVDPPLGGLCLVITLTSCLARELHGRVVVPSTATSGSVPGPWCSKLVSSFTALLSSTSSL